ncbi:MAG: hypothetical protein H6667_26120 [Ardenticatenaceae bacterium]|nr:hypothetical protein [Ardenticatenaceae bacterium]MCB9444268.1 hypothetical protein [Ardenticatenaceae bacterium]
MIKKQPGLAVLVAFIVGLFLGLVFLGWYVFPVQWTDAGPQHMAEADQARYIRTVADLYSFQGDQQKVQEALGGWGGDVAACKLAATSSDPAEVARLEAVASIVSGQPGCGAIMGGDTAVTSTEEESGGSSFGTLLLLGLLLLFLLAAIVFVINRRNSLAAGDSGRGGYDMPDSAPTGGEDGMITTPLARFQTTYSFGHDSFDDSFSIENANGDFLGECGVGISESIGTDSPKNVTALEVWLFDKNDIRTVTKVIMSDHAFFDEALKAKLAPKGEPVLARENETVVLETASLIINAEIRDMQYGTGTLPPQSYFEQITIELSAWAKEGDYAPPDIEGRVDELMNY